MGLDCWSCVELVDGGGETYLSVGVRIVGVFLEELHKSQEAFRNKLQLWRLLIVLRGALLFL